MCIAIFNSHDGDTITQDQAWNSWLTNGDGMGMLWAEDGVLQVHRQLDGFAEFYKKYVEVRTGRDQNILLHFRIGTQGPKDLNNCHPFLINDNIGFIHNGILRNCKAAYTGDPRSDTRIYMQQVLRKLPRTWLGNHVIRGLIEDHIGYGNKLVFMTRKGAVVILNGDRGHWSNGNWFSNDSYKWGSKRFIGDDIGASKYLGTSGGGATVENRRNHYHGCGSNVHNLWDLKETSDVGYVNDTTPLALVGVGKNEVEEDDVIPEMGYWLTAWYCYECLPYTSEHSILPMRASECFQECSVCHKALGNGIMSWDDLEGVLEDAIEDDIVGTEMN